MDLNVRRRILASCTVASIVLSMLGIACSTSDVIPAPPDTSPRLCDQGVFVAPCDAGAPNALGACTGNPKAPSDVRFIPSDRSFPVGCRGYFPARDCTPIDNCYCRADDGDAGTAKWICER